MAALARGFELRRDSRMQCLRVALRAQLQADALDHEVTMLGILHLEEANGLWQPNSVKGIAESPAGKQFASECGSQAEQWVRALDRLGEDPRFGEGAVELDAALTCEEMQLQDDLPTKMARQDKLTQVEVAEPLSEMAATAADAPPAEVPQPQPEQANAPRSEMPAISHK